MKLECNTGYSLCSKRFRLVSGQRNTKEGDFRFWPREKWNENQKVKEGGGGGEGRKRSFPSFLPHPLLGLLLAPLFSRSLTLVPRSFLLNRTETLATQAILGISLLSISRLKKINQYPNPLIRLKREEKMHRLETQPTFRKLSKRNGTTNHLR